MDKQNLRWNAFQYWDPWPLTRLLLVLATLSLWAHLQNGCALPTPPVLGRAAFGLFEAFCLCTLVSFTLARLLVVILMFPLYAIIVLNDWFYDGSYWLIRFLTGPRSPRWKAGFALAGELGLFVGLCRSMEFLLRNYL
jgi:hypothetical protein